MVSWEMELDKQNVLDANLLPLPKIVWKIVIVY